MKVMIMDYVNWTPIENGGFQLQANYYMTAETSQEAEVIASVGYGRSRTVDFTGLEDAPTMRKMTCRAIRDEILELYNVEVPSSDISMIDIVKGSY